MLEESINDNTVQGGYQDGSQGRSEMTRRSSSTAEVAITEHRVLNTECFVV
jgi:hypothetical protein